MPAAARLHKETRHSETLAASSGAPFFNVTITAAAAQIRTEPVTRAAKGKFTTLGAIKAMISLAPTMEETMVAKPAVVGVAAAAFSTAAFAGPCMQPTMAADPATGLSSRADDKPLGTSVDAPHGAITAEADATDNQAVAETPAADFASLIDVTEPSTGAAANAEIFSSDGIKITSFQATMTANKYVASPFAPAPPLHVTDDLTFYGPAYLSVKAMSPPPKKRRPPVVGVGLVTAPSQNAKKSDGAAGSGLAQPNSPAPGRK